MIASKFPYALLVSPTTVSTTFLNVLSCSHSHSLRLILPNEMDAWASWMDLWCDAKSLARLVKDRAVLLVASKAALYGGPKENAQGEKRSGEYMDKLWTNLVTFRATASREEGYWSAPRFSVRLRCLSPVRRCRCCQSEAPVLIKTPVFAHIRPSVLHLIPTPHSDATGPAPMGTTRPSSLESAMKVWLRADMQKTGALMRG